MAELVAGIDLGATKIAIGLVNQQQQIIAQRRLPTDGADGPHSMVARTVAALTELMAHQPKQQLAAVGMGAPGPVDRQQGTLVEAPNLPGWGVVPLQQMLSDALSLPVVLEHDAKAAALAEARYGAGQGQSSLVYIVIGTGVGAAIIIDNKIYRGTANVAGEIGHMTIDRDAAPGSSGIKGCFESFISGPSMAAYYRTLLTERGQPLPQEPITGETVGRLAQAGEPAARQVVSRGGEALGVAVASLAMILDIEHYIIGSSVAQLGDLLFIPARETLPQYCFRSVAQRIRIVPYQMEHAGVIGAALLARDYLATASTRKPH